jgi:hypothetical protein
MTWRALAVDTDLRLPWRRCRAEPMSTTTR